ncbi:MAG TPA: 3-phosphoshikimate 1-carboxyvinyltransferase, partial [Casimicrobiaceae bacterium]|nr:3-phosphoshikimate 1-carboxyvinyltransferase [Casimicrobiaceae bacterium]
MGSASAAPAYLDLAPVNRVAGTVALPGSKSISNRTLLLAALANGDTLVRSLLDADDVERMLDALTALGIGIERLPQSRDCRVRGLGGRFPVKAAKLFLGNAGTAFRPLTAVLAFAGGDYELSGVSRMHERPIGDLVDALRALGAEIDYLGNAGFPPLAIRSDRAAALARDRVSVRGNVSSQFTSALLMALPALATRLARPVTVDIEGELISKPYVAITTNLMRRFGVAVAQEEWRSFTGPAGARFESPGSIRVEGDASTASYFLGA